MDPQHALLGKVHSSHHVIDCLFAGTFTVVAVPLLVGLSGRKVSWTTWVAAVTAIIGVGMLTSSGGDPT